MDFDCGLSLKINLNMIVYIVSVVLTIYGTHNIILQVITGIPCLIIQFFQ